MWRTTTWSIKVEATQVASLRRALESSGMKLFTQVIPSSKFYLTI